MNREFSSVKVAVVQAAPVLFDREATVENACGLIREAAAQGAQLILFPEAFIPAYPRGLSFGMVVGSRTLEGRRTWQMVWESAVEIPSSTTEALGNVVRETGVHLAMGGASSGTGSSAAGRSTARCFTSVRMARSQANIASSSRPARSA